MKRKLVACKQTNIEKRETQNLIPSKGFAFARPCKHSLKQSHHIDVVERNCTGLLARLVSIWFLETEKKVTSHYPKPTGPANTQRAAIERTTCSSLLNKYLFCNYARFPPTLKTLASSNKKAVNLGPSDYFQFGPIFFGWRVARGYNPDHAYVRVLACVRGQRVCAYLSLGFSTMTLHHQPPETVTT